jgi:hypothetical protein
MQPLYCLPAPTPLPSLASSFLLFPRVSPPFGLLSPLPSTFLYVSLTLTTLSSLVPPVNSHAPARRRGARTHETGGAYLLLLLLLLLLFTYNTATDCLCLDVGVGTTLPFFSVNNHCLGARGVRE